MTMSNLFNLALSLEMPILHNHHNLTTDIKNIIASVLNVMFNCITIALYLVSAFMVIVMGDISQTASSSNTNNESTPGDSSGLNCNPQLYNFTFWFVTLSLGCLAVLCLVGGALFGYNKYRLALIRGATPRFQTQADSTQATGTGTAISH